MTSFLIRKKFLPLVGLLLLGGAHRALAEPLHFVCKGEDSYVKAGQVVSIIKDTVSLTVEMDAETAWVGGYGNGVIMPIEKTGGPNEMLIMGGDVHLGADVHSRSGPWIANLDRVTGSFNVTLVAAPGMLRDGKYFVGTCQAGKKLF
jgi:hypothetical protein